jgi:hypothetical protein
VEQVKEEKRSDDCARPDHVPPCEGGALV